jgi:hypothetical protein
MVSYLVNERVNISLQSSYVVLMCFLTLHFNMIELKGTLTNNPLCSEL